MREPRDSKSKKTWLGKVWYFLHEDNSIWSWLVNIAIAFVIVKFLIYPGLGMVLDTDYPVVAVVSSSMEHNGLGFEEWWDENGEWYLDNDFPKGQFENSIFLNGFNKGDIIVLQGVDYDDVLIGDVLVYSSETHIYPIIHRVVSIDEDEEGYRYIFKGDNNPREDPLEVDEERLLGKAWFKIPYLGYVKIWATNLIMLIGGK